MTEYTLHLGDCLETLRTLPDNSVDSIVTDPPYGLSKEPDMAEVLRHWMAGDDYQHKGGGFMGKSWDSFVPGPAIWRECLRVLKPGGHLLAFFGTRTQDIGTLAIRLAGFEIRDSIAWVYGSGFPKSMDVSKAIDKAGPPGQAPFEEFAEHYETRRKALGLTHAKICAHGGWHGAVNHGGSSVNWANGYGMPTTEQWPQLRDLLGLDEKWAERVARVQYEREVLGIKHGTRIAVAPGQGEDRGDVGLEITAPGSDAARQWQGWGTALKPALEPITVARKPLVGTVAANVLAHGAGAINVDACRIGGEGGRWPANLIHDGSDEVVALFPESSVTGKRSDKSKVATVAGTAWLSDNHKPTEYTDSGSAARFFKQVQPEAEDFEAARRLFYCAKASKKDRGAENNHPTVKPTDLMAYLCRLVTPPGGTVLDPFMGSGSTGKAAMREGFRFIGCELSPEYLAIAEARIEHELAKRAPKPANDNNPQLDLLAGVI